MAWQLWDFSSTGDGQAHIIAAGGVPPILSVMGAACADDDLQKKALSMLWNLTISAAGISALVQHAGIICAHARARHPGTLAALL